MTKRLGMAALCAALAACGGNSGSGSNSASGKAFTYDTPQPYTGSQAASVTNEIATVVGGTASSTTGLTAVNAGTVLGADYYTNMPASLAATARSKAIMAVSASKELTSEFDDSSCYKEAADGSSATFTNCTITTKDTSYENTLTLNGTASLTGSGDSRELKWDLKIADTFTGSGTNSGVSFHVAFDYSGDLKGSKSHIAGEVLSSIAFDATSGSKSVKAGLDESLAIDLNLDDTCSSHAVAGSTLEAKRVWTTRPSSGGPWLDKAAKITWTGCGAATIEVSKS